MQRRLIEATTLGDLLDRQAQEQPDRIALAFPSGEMSYRELAARANQLARGLIGLGVNRGDAVGILLTNCVDSVSTLCAVAKIGAIPVPVNSRFKSYELSQLVTQSGIRVLLTETPADPAAPDFTALLVDTFPSLRCEEVGDRLLLPEAPELEHIVTLNTAGGRAPFLTEAELVGLAERVEQAEVDRRQVLVRIRDTALVMYTSGTTASPKGAMLSHEAFSRFAAATVHELFSLSPDDRIWTALPLFHIGGIAFAIASLYAGATYVHTGFYTPATALDQLESSRATVALPGFETIWLPVLNRPDFAERDLSALRQVMVVGVPQRQRDMAARLPHTTLISCFGMTEACSFLSLNRPDDTLEQRITTGGHPLPGMECRVIGPDGQDVPANTHGELLFRGSNCFDGYFKEPELTARSFDADGWFHSGDIATMDPDGRVTFVGRVKDMLKVGGENVAAGEIEGFLLTHPAVLMAQVVAAPDAHYVEVPAAYLELVPGATVTEREIIEYCLGSVATYRVPRYVRFVEEWPMSGTKIKKFVLRDRIREELDSLGITTAPKPVAAVTR
ncbi:class I adenylate-forming enzyme family protein [Pseudonocardia spinosispora]|uniref:class I adenylate-forming enzyme family protein n=1 Tax=Pseudonocardia spinosispora TaxID=103441 RepID=UPI0004002E0C|nr:AMP-binding protein [Pseudonocardia spinosispora]